MSNTFYVGVDAGNSKTQYVLVDNKGNILNYLRAGTASHERFADGYLGMQRELEKQFKLLLEPFGLQASQIDISVFGMAGIDNEEQKINCEKAIHELGFEHIIACNDAYLGIKAGSRFSYGVCSINGAGACCVAIDPRGKSIQIGGLGTMFGDDSGALHMGTLVIRRCYEQFYRCGKATIMSDMLFEKLEINDYTKLVETVNKKVFETRTIPVDQLARIIYLAAMQGDEVACNLLKDTGENAAYAILGAISHLDFSEAEEIDVVLAGSGYTKAESTLMIDTLREVVNSKSKKPIRYVVLGTPPVTGAVLWAMEEGKCVLTPEIKQHIYEELKRRDSEKSCNGS